MPESRLTARRLDLRLAIIVDARFEAAIPVCAFEMMI